MLYYINDTSDFIAVGRLNVYRKDLIYILRVDVFESKESDQRTSIDHEIIKPYNEHVGIPSAFLDRR